MITPQSVYDLVLRCIGNNTCSVCDLHKPCIGHPCACVQHTPVIDFDEVERLWHISRKQPSTASADALVCHHNLCFVEIKGWIKFLENLHLTGERQFTDREEERLKGRILKQVGHYDFQKKLLSSIEVCEDITGTPDLYLRFLWHLSLSLMSIRKPVRWKCSPCSCPCWRILLPIGRKYVQKPCHSV